MPGMEAILDWPEFVKLFVGLVAIANPVAAIPIMASAMGEMTPGYHRQIILMAVLTFIVTLVLFAFIGEGILKFLGISIESFRIAGGILLLLTAIQMMSGNVLTDSDTNGTNPEVGKALGIVPIGIPILAGPGAISTIIIYAHRTETLAHDVIVTGVILVVAIMIFLTLLIAPMLNRLMGKTGLVVFNRVMGLIIAAIGIEFIVSGLAVHFPGLAG